MLNRALLLRLSLLLVGLFATGVVLAQNETPTLIDATRIRFAHLAPFALSGEDSTVSIEVNGIPIANQLSYSDREDYSSLPTGPGDYQIKVLSDGGAIISNTITLDDGDYSIAIIGDMNLVPADLLVLPENATPPTSGRTVLRVAHTAPIAATADETRVDVCTQDGISFDKSANNLRYKQASSFKSIPAATYDLKITRAVVDAPCTGQTIIDPPEIALPDGAITTLYLVGDGTNRPTAVFTFRDGLIGVDPEPTKGEIFVPAILK